MGSEWKTVRIEEVAEKVGIGPFGSSIKVETFVPFGIPIISGQHLKGSRLEDNTYNYISEAHADRLKNANVFRGDVIFTHAGNIGQVAYIPDESKYDRYILSQRQFYMRCNNEFVIPQFIVYFFKSHLGQHKLLSNASQVGVPSIAQPVSSLRRIEIPLPPLPEQHAIAHILGTLDDKIELNRRMNETLEAMARALFKSWFVDFDPVRAKAEGRDTGLPSEISDLFPEEFEDSELGEIPKGWKVSIVKQHFHLSMGQSPPGESYNTSGQGLPFYQGRSDFGFRFPKRRVYCTSPTRFAKSGDTLVSVRAPVGDINIAIEDCAIGRGVASIRHKDGSIPFTYHSMFYLKNHFERYDKEGTVFGSINKGAFENIPIIVPESTILKAFEHIASPIEKKIHLIEREILSLSSLRDTLLPKLISGEIRVEEAEKYLEVVET